MNHHPFRTLRHLVTAMTLLLVAGVGTELVLRQRMSPFPACVSPRVGADLQQLLISTSDCHHSLRPAACLQISDGSKRIKLTTNQFGCRVADSAGAENPPGFRILLLGDDSICGPFVDDRQTVAAHLQKLLSKHQSVPVSVLNGGVPGHCPLLSLLFFEHNLAELAPDLVVLHFDMTDVADDIYYRPLLRETPKGSYCPHPSTVWQHQQQRRQSADPFSLVRNTVTGSWCLNRIEEHCNDRCQNSGIANQSAAPLAWISDAPPDLRMQVRHALDSVRKLDEAVRRHGGRLIVTTSPVIWQMLPVSAAPQLASRCQVFGATPYSSRLPFRILREYCEQIRVPFCDTSEEFRTFRSPERLFDHSHLMLSRPGMALYAREIAEFVLSESLISGKEATNRITMDELSGAGSVSTSGRF